ncbi:hypothetical protein [Kitasatospora sp. NPDC088346]|uniref:hypothetical protein n=1 Tax=Kitasatospora sp. NPDC088346 TaxID=3364073 RepID=UPI0038043B36
MSDLLAPLDHDQLILLSTMAGPYLRDGEWPVWHYVAAQLEECDLNADKLIRSLPMVGDPGHGARYGIASFDRNILQDDSRPALTVAAALHAPELQPVMGAWFLRVFKAIVDIQLETPTSAQAVTRAEFSSAVLKERFPAIGDPFLKALPGILDREPATRISSNVWMSTDDPTNWSRSIHREILKYRDVNSLEDYVRRVVELMPRPELPRRWAAPVVDTLVFPEAVPPVATPIVLAAPRPEYVDAKLITELEQKAGTTAWKLDKFLQLARELNDNFANENPYACHALLRAIIDHVPPVFGQGSFEQVASSHPWGHTDKAYMRKLVEFKKAADDVMHRQIRRSENVISMHDLPLRSYVNALLRAFADLL